MTRIRIALTGLAMAGTFVLLTPALAQQDGSASGTAGTRIEQFFKSVDKDANGAISADEFAAWQKTRFEEIDTDKNGSLSLDEFTAEVKTKPAALKRRTDRFKTLDTDGDGQLSEEEMQASHSARFASMDADGNGQVTQQEFDNALRNHRMGSL